jgi:glycosyltransferase involved in cell wall biosynthesis
VVIPTFNYARFLGEAIESALAQTYPCIEVIVMDDGSTDNTPEVAAAFGARIRYVRGENRGVYATRQASLAHVRGEYFLNLDADNRLHPEFVAKTMAVAQEHADDPQFAFVYTDMDKFGNQTGRVRRPPFDPALLKKKNYVDMNSLIRLSVIRHFGFDPAFNSGQGDYDFFLTLAEHGYHGVLVPEPLLQYRVHSSSISSTVMRQYRQRDIMKRLLKKHSGFYSLEERQLALATSDNSILVAIITNRTPSASLTRRLKDLWQFAGTTVRHAEFLNQLLYTIAPSLYFRRKHGPPS